MNLTGLKLKMRKLNIGTIKRFLLLCFMMSGFLMMRGQENNDTKDKIMEIKLNEDFIFGEGVSNDKDIAYGEAMDDLLIFANELKERNSQEKLSLSDLLTKVETLVYENGTRYEVVVYIPLKTVIETERKDPSARSGIQLTRPGVLEMEEDEPEIEEEIPMVAETPVAEETTVVTEIPVEEETQAMDETPVEEETLPAAESPVVEEVIAEEVLPIKEEPVAPISQERPKAAAVPSNTSSFSPGEVEGFLLTQDNFTEIKSFLSEMKRSGKITETGAADSLSDLPHDASLILIDELGGILAYLSPANEQGRINYKTHKSDSENNYNSKFIVWYRK